MIQATAFNEMADHVNKNLNLSCVYTIADGTVKMANQRYSSIKNDLCLVIDESSVIGHCADDPKIQSDGFAFSRIDSIEGIPQQTNLDVIGMVLEVGPSID